MRDEIVACLAVGALACGGESGETPSGSEEAGAEGPEAIPTWTVSREPLVVIGNDERRPGHAFRNVEGATRLSDGRIVVADGSSEIRIFSDGGDLLATGGGPGEGPQEFHRGIASFSRGRGDTILILSGDLAFKVVSPDGLVVDQARIGWGPLGFQCHMTQPEAIIPAADHGLIVQAGEAGRAGCPPMAEGRYRTTDLVMRLDVETHDLDTLGVFPGTERDGGGFAAFGRSLAVAISTDRVFVGDTGGDSIAVFSLSGERRGSWTVPLGARTIPGSVRMPQVEPRLQRDGSVAAPGALALELDSIYPRFGRLLADGVGYLWVMSYPPLDEPVDAFRLKSLNTWVVDPEGADWTVMSPDGRVTASVRTPQDLYVLEVGTDYVLGVVRNELDVESVRLYELTR